MSDLHLDEDTSSSMDLDEDTSPTLLVAVRSLNDQESWQRFLATYEPLMTQWLRARKVPDFAIPAILSDVYFKLLRHLPQFVYDQSQSFRAWLRTVVENALIDAEKKAYRRYEHTVENSAIEMLSHHHSAADQSDELLDELVDRLGRRVALANAIVSRVRRRVAEKTWQAFYLTEIEQQSGPDVAERLGMSEASVYTARFRVRNHLQQEAGLTESEEA